MRIFTFFLLIFFGCINLGNAQSYPPISYTSNLNNPKLLILKRHPKSLQDSLFKKYLPKYYTDKSIKLIAVLSFKDKKKLISFWKIKRQNVFEVRAIEKIDEKINIIKASTYPEISTGFGKLKVDVFKELLFLNGRYKNEEFKKLHKVTRGNFGLLNISKLSFEIKNSSSKYKELLD